MGRGTKIVIVCIAVVCILIGVLWDTVRSSTIGRLDDGADVKVAVKNGSALSNQIVQPRAGAGAGGGPAAQYDAHDRRETPAPEPRAYEVKAGDTLSRIAGAFYNGREELYPLIEKANPGVKATGLKKGQRLVIPPAPDRPAGATAPAAPAADGTTTYEVKPGDVGERISRQVYGNAGQWERIKKANPGIDERNLRPGTKLIIPPLGATSRP
ncbi:MAG: LysM peptidoglycan-binding domain-containing protein [Planctomycetes bacterium]|nr:LysM peptidoglycan-binding domain-containing protein [Planctomycetota bacterium]